MDINKITSIIDKAIPDKTESDRLKVELVKELNSATLEKAKIEAQIKTKLFERLPIPMILYIFLGLIVYNSILIPIINMIFKVSIPILPIDSNLYDLVQWIIGSVFVKKSVDSVSSSIKK